MRHVKLAACLLMVLGIASCQKSMSTDEINEKARSGVVLIMNYYYYSVTLPSGEELFFSDINDGELVGLTDDEKVDPLHGRLSRVLLDERREVTNV